MSPNPVKSSAEVAIRYRHDFGRDIRQTQNALGVACLRVSMRAVQSPPERQSARPVRRWWTDRHRLPLRTLQPDQTALVLRRRRYRRSVPSHQSGDGSRTNSSPLTTHDRHTTTESTIDTGWFESKRSIPECQGTEFAARHVKPTNARTGNIYHSVLLF